MDELNGTNSTAQRAFYQATSPVATHLFEAFIPGFGVLSNALASYLNIDLSSIITCVLLVVSFFSAGKWIHNAVSDALARWCTASVYIDEWDDLFDNIMDWISANTVTSNARRLTAKTRSDFPWHLTPTDLLPGRSFNFKDFEARFPPIFSPAYGDHWFWHKGRLFWFERDRRQVQDSRSWRQETTDKEYVRLSCLGWSTSPLKALIDECRFDAAEKERASTIIRFPNAGRGMYWSRAGVRASRAVDTIYLAQDKKNAVLSDIEAFLQPAARHFYSHRGIPYRRGYLFWGEPGTGKTSMAFGIAGMYGLSLEVLSLSDPSLSDQDLQSLFASLPMSCVVLMEDIDTILVSRKKSDEEKAEEEKEKEKDKAAADATSAAPAPKKGRFNGRNSKATGVTLSGLLNALDGVASQEGRILIMTTNAPDVLDPALVRPGRVDMQVYFGHLTKQCAREMFVRMFDMDVPGLQESDDLTKLLDDRASHADDKHEYPRGPTNVAELAQQFAAMLPEGKLTPAEVQGFLLRQRNNPHTAILEFEAWATETIETKEKGENVVQPADEKAETGSKEAGKKGGLFGRK